MSLPVFDEATRHELAALLAAPLATSFSHPAAIKRAASRLSALNGVAEPADSPSAAALLLRSLASHGQAYVVCDYVHEVCADAGLAASDAEDQALLDGSLAQAFVEQTVTTVAHRLRKCTADDAADLGSLHCCVQAATAVNDALRTAGLADALHGVPPGMGRG